MLRAIVDIALFPLAILLVLTGILSWPEDDFGAWPQALVILGLLCLGVGLHRHKRHRQHRQHRSVLKARIRSEAEGIKKELLATVHSAFSVERCQRCHESEFRLISMSPNARSIRLKCTSCGKEVYAAACSGDMYGVKCVYDRFMEKIEEYPSALRYFELNAHPVFSVPESKITLTPTEKSL